MRQGVRMNSDDRISDLSLADLALPAAVIVHDLAGALAALAPGQPVTLLSAPGAALYAGCGWWKALIAAARTAHPTVACVDILDCADATGFALAAARIGIVRLVLWPDAAGRDAAAAIVTGMGGFVLACRPAVNARRCPERLVLDQ